MAYHRFINLTATEMWSIKVTVESSTFPKDTDGIYKITEGVVRIYAEITDKDGNLITPSSYRRITIYAPDGTKVVNAQALTTEATGKFSYTWDINYNARKGLHTVKVYASDATNTVIFVQRLIELTSLRGVD